MISRQIVALGAGVYVSVAALALVLGIHIGWGRLKRRPLSLLLIGVAVLGLPAGGAAMAGMKY
jgi:hypothetical protein